MKQLNFTSKSQKVTINDWNLSKSAQFGVNYIFHQSSRECSWWLIFIIVL